MKEMEFNPTEEAGDEVLFNKFVEGLQKAGFKLEEAYSAARLSFSDLKPVLKKIFQGGS